MTHGQRTLLAVFAHPDDESFGCGGTLARCAAEGVRVALVCATRGEVGEIADPTLATPETLAQVRQSELESAAKALGIGDLTFLDYRDSGMEGSPDNADPRAYVQAPEDEVVARLVCVMRRIRPQVVVTFDPSGGYGHPDHIAVHRHTVAAFHAAGDAGRYPEQGAPWKPSRLFYAVFTRSRFLKMRDRMVELGEETSRYDQRLEEGFGWPDDQVHAAIDVSSTVEAKWQALRSHRTQFGTFNLLRRIPEATAKQFMSLETFALASPQPPPGLRLTHLFDGI
jgi:N-acetyl-1-D-myo-inositol-2-amino-2-deoxy-alpha-D-glucopyranoside deacetylase